MVHLRRALGAVRAFDLCDAYNRAVLSRTSLEAAGASIWRTIIPDANLCSRTSGLVRSNGTTLRIAYVGRLEGTCLQRAVALERLGHAVSLIDPFDWIGRSI